jgi:hypothetical protein
MSELAIEILRDQNRRHHDHARKVAPLVVNRPDPGPPEGPGKPQDETPGGRPTETRTQARIAPEGLSEAMLQRLRALWASFHLHALMYRGNQAEELIWLRDFTASVPCGGCRGHFIDVCNLDPPDLSSRESYFAWTVRVHNAINRELGKPEVSLDEATSLWTRAVP